MFQKIKAFFQAFKALGLIKSATEEVKTMDGDIKPGFTTTEWWGKNALQLITLGATIYGMFGHGTISPDTQQAIATMGLKIMVGFEGAYMGFRTLLKIFQEWRKAKEAQAAPAVVALPVAAAPAQ